MNNWSIPSEMEENVRKRDTKCVYCNKSFSKDFPPTWEHIINDEKIITYENIALCCRGCNSSKGQKTLNVWISSEYCQKKNVFPDTVADIIKIALKNCE